MAMICGEKTLSFISTTIVFTVGLDTGFGVGVVVGFTVAGTVVGTTAVGETGSVVALGTGIWAGVGDGAVAQPAPMRATSKPMERKRRIEQREKKNDLLQFIRLIHGWIAEVKTLPLPTVKKRGINSTPIPYGGYGEEVITAGCGPVIEGSIPSSHPNKIRPCYRSDFV